MKNFLDKFWKKNHELIIVLFSVGVLIFALYQFSILIYPEWKNTPKGDLILMSSICLGILINLKNIIELVEKLFFKKDKYKFSEDEKNAIRWLYNELVINKKTNDFRFGYFVNGNIFIQKPSGIRGEDIPPITKGVLVALMKSELIWFEDSINSGNEYLGRIYSIPTIKAIESKFKE